MKQHIPRPWWIGQILRVNSWMLLSLVGVGLVVVGLLLPLGGNTFTLLDVQDRVDAWLFGAFHVDLARRETATAVAYSAGAIGLVAVLVSFWQVNRSILRRRDMSE